MTSTVLVRAGKRVPGPLALLLALSAILAFTWAVVTPPLINADETGHFAYVQYLAETDHGPSSTGGRQTLSSEETMLLNTLGLQRSIGNANAQPSFAPVDRAAFEAAERSTTHAQRSDASGPNQFAQNGPLYYFLGAAAYKLTPGGTIIDHVVMVRLLGGLMFVGTVWLTWLLAAELFAGIWPRALAASVVMLQPKLGNLAGTVNPDVLLTLLWTAFAWLGVRTVIRGLSIRRAVGLGLLAGGSLLTHGRGLAIVPALLVVLVAVLVPRAGARLAPRAWLPGAGAAFAVLVVGAVIGFAWTGAHSSGAYGGELGQAAGGAQSAGSLSGLVGYVLGFYVGPYQALGTALGPGFGYRQGYVETFFGSLGSLEVVFQPHVFDWLEALAAAGLLALWTLSFLRRDRLFARWREVSVMAALCVAMIGLLHLSSYRDLVQTNGVAVLWTGRYLLPLIAVFGVTVAWVCATLPRRWGAVATGVVLGAGVLLQVGSLGVTLSRFYS